MAFVRTQAVNSVLYTEVRFAPQLLSGPKTPVEKVVQSALKGIDRGVSAVSGTAPGLRVNLILCCMRGRSPELCYEVVDLAKRFAPKWSKSGVVGIDFAEGGGPSVAPFDAWVAPFRYAKSVGVLATVHAGEECKPPDDCPRNCGIAFRSMGARRIGHGYHCGDDIWAQLQNASVHLEACPSSSIGTGAVNGWANHPLKTYAERGYSFGINTDDEGVLDTNMSREVYLSESKIGLSAAQVDAAMLNAAEAAFLPQSEVLDLQRRLRIARTTVVLV